MTHHLLAGFLFGLTAAFSPGPLQAYFISQTLAHGWRRTLPALLAPLVTDIPIGLFVLFFLKYVPSTFLQVLQGIGGFFLLYLAYRTWLLWRKNDSKQASATPLQHQTLMHAIVINLLNPNPYLGWSLVLGPLFLTGWHAAPLYAAILLLGFYGTHIGTSAILIIVIARAKAFSPSLSHHLLGISAGVLAAFGLFQWWRLLFPA